MPSRHLYVIPLYSLLSFSLSLVHSDRFTSVAQTLQGTNRRKGQRAPYYPNMDILESPGMSLGQVPIFQSVCAGSMLSLLHTEDKDASFMYRADMENESTLTVNDIPPNLT